MKVFLFCILAISVTSAYYLKYFLNDRYPDLKRRLPESNSYAEYLNSIALYKRRMQLLGLYPLVSVAEIRRYEEKQLNYGNEESGAENEVLFFHNVDFGDRYSDSKDNELDEISNTIQDNSDNFYDNEDRLAVQATQNMIDTNSIPSYDIVDFNSENDLEDSNQGDHKPTVLDQVIESIVQLIVNESGPMSAEPEVILNMLDSNKDQFDTFENNGDDFSHDVNEIQSGNKNEIKISSTATESISKQEADPERANSNQMGNGILNLGDNAIINDLIEILDPEKVVNDERTSDEMITAASIKDNIPVESSIISADDLLHFIDDPTGLELFDEFVTSRTETINKNQSSVSEQDKFDDTTNYKKIVLEDKLKINRNKLENRTEQYEQNKGTDLDSDFKQNEIEDRPILVRLNVNVANMAKDQLEKTSNANRSIENESSITEDNENNDILVNVAENEKKGKIFNQENSTEQINGVLKENKKLNIQEEMKELISNSTENLSDMKIGEQNLATVNISKFESSTLIKDQLTKPQIVINESPSEFKTYDEIPIISNNSVKKPAAIDVPLEDNQILRTETHKNIDAIQRKFEQNSNKFDDYEPIYDFNDLLKFKVDVNENKSQVKKIEQPDHIELNINNSKFEAITLQNTDQPLMAKDETIISNDQTKKLGNQVPRDGTVEDRSEKSKPIFEHSSIRFDDYEPIYDFNDLSKFKVNAIEKENDKLIANQGNETKQFDHSSVVDCNPLTSDVNVEKHLTFATTPLVVELKPPNSGKESELHDINKSSVKTNSELITENDDDKTNKLKYDVNHINDRQVVTNLSKQSAKLDDEIADNMDLDHAETDTITDDLHNISNSLNEQSTLKNLNLTKLNSSRDQAYNILDLKLDKIKPIDKTDGIDIEYQNADDKISLSNDHENFTYIEEVKDQFDEHSDITDETLEKIPKFDLLLKNSSEKYNEEIADDQNKRIETNDFYEPSQLLHDNEEIINYSRNSFEEEITSGKNSETSIGDQRRSDILIEDNFDSFDDNADYSITQDSDGTFEPRANQESDLLQLIPFIIEQYRRGGISKVEEDTLSKSMGDLWPIIQAEVNRKPNEEMNPVLATLLNTTEEID